MPDGNRPDSRRRSPASRPGKAGDAGRRRRPNKPTQVSAKPTAKPSASPTVGGATTRTPFEHVVEPIKRQAAESVEHRSDQRLGFTARRAAVLAAVVCVLTLTIAGPVRTYFAQRTEMNQLSASQAALRAQITELESKKAKLADPAYIAAQARERLGFVKPGDIPFQVQLPPTAAVPVQPGTQSAKPANNDPWYTSLWHTIADAPHLPPAAAPETSAPQPNSPAPTPTPPGG
ncbi:MULTISPECIES: septum formation initiator family protein [unclassified Mycobacterium]|uniref:FtsB family cell division protein n=1 Tax=unclassified Mycobacterium TaxID=2642494 RepID=UPI0007FD2BB2|nr:MULTISPECIES: septum formation initiator family protein [unclassified Mycobacterium]OBG70566.1 septation inhibitor protein [Mycobacterium sp. E1214]OBH31240.1 septation inhibitor protein [Mycobacterium sp. E1319]